MRSRRGSSSRQQEEGTQKSVSEDSTARCGGELLQGPRCRAQEIMMMTR